MFRMDGNERKKVAQKLKKFRNIKINGRVIAVNVTRFSKKFKPSNKNGNSRSRKFRTSSRSKKEISPSVRQSNHGPKRSISSVRHRKMDSNGSQYGNLAQAKHSYRAKYPKKDTFVAPGIQQDPSFNKSYFPNLRMVNV
jgi:hypothetical protein